jgi:hypothetical protein
MGMFSTAKNVMADEMLVPYPWIRSHFTCKTKVHPSYTEHRGIIEIEIDVRRPWNVAPGQYVHVFLPSSRQLGLSLSESYSVVIAWGITNEQRQVQTITVEYTD